MEQYKLFATEIQEMIGEFLNKMNEDAPK